MSNHKKYCQGCRTYVYTYTNKYICADNMKNPSECPCTQCLVKSVCSDGCDDFFRSKEKERYNG